MELVHLTPLVRVSLRIAKRGRIRGASEASARRVVSYMDM